jgi:hypothetical protein
LSITVPDNSDAEPKESEEDYARRYYGDARERTAEIYQLYDFEEMRCAGPYQIPMIEATQHRPSRLVGFNYVFNTDAFDAGVHFYLDDYQFERIWNNPRKYFDRPQLFDCVLSPDFSLY